ALPAGQLEPSSKTLLPRMAAEIRYCAHFRIVRFARTGSRHCLPEARDSLCGRTNRDVCADCAQSVAETAVSPHLGKDTAPEGKRGSSDFGARDRRARGGRNRSIKDRVAAKWHAGAGGIARGEKVSRKAWDFAGGE